MKTFTLAPDLVQSLRVVAIRAYPNECCGLITGTRDGDTVCADQIHETQNLAEEKKRRFMIDPAVQFALMRQLRDTGGEVLGCFHSHPDGLPEPSETDRAEASEDGFVWLIAAGNPTMGFTVKAFTFEAEARRFAPLALISEASGRI